MKSSSRISGDSMDSSGSSEIGGFKFFNGLSPAMDFNLGGLSFPRLNPSPSSLFNQFSPFGDFPANSATAGGNSAPCFSLDPAPAGPLIGFNYPVNDVGGGSMNVNSSLASSIESLSSINQDLHWKLQQQRLATLFAGDDQKNQPPPPEKPQPILFQNLEISKPEASGAAGNSKKEGGNGSRDTAATEWFFGNSYAQVNPNPANSNSHGVQGWPDLHQYNGLP